MSDEKYLRYLKINAEITKDYHLKSLNKTFQQIFLEERLLPLILSSKENYQPSVIADIACGAGTLSYHLRKLFPNSKFILSDINDDAINLARSIMTNANNIEYLIEDFTKTSIPNDYCDLVFCFQTLLIVANPKKFMDNIIKITKKGGFFIVSSLFNLEHDVDLYCKFIDHTRKGKTKMSYNTFSKITINKWLKGKVEFFDIIPFEMPKSLEKKGRGIGSYTVKTEDSKYLTISGGILMQWGFLYGQK